MPPACSPTARQTCKRSNFSTNANIRMDVLACQCVTFLIAPARSQRSFATAATCGASCREEVDSSGMSGFQAAIPPDHIEHLNHRAMIPLLQVIVAARIPDCGPGPAMDGRVQLRLAPERAARTPTVTPHRRPTSSDPSKCDRGRDTESPS